MTPKSLRVVTYISPTEDPLLYAELVALDKGDRSARARTLLRSGQSGRTDSQSNGAAQRAAGEPAQTPPAVQVQVPTPLEMTLDMFPVAGGDSRHG